MAIARCMRRALNCRTRSRSSSWTVCLLFAMKIMNSVSTMATPSHGMMRSTVSPGTDELLRKASAPPRKTASSESASNPSAAGNATTTSQNRPGLASRLSRRASIMLAGAERLAPGTFSATGAS